jgi:NAD(P)-dependent dehydrogenase (short-subunit alcohol dehydrogenase family)
MTALGRDQIAGFASALHRTHAVQTVACACDLSDPDAIADVFDTIRADLGDPEVLVYNVARWHAAPALEMPPDTFARDLALNVVGALACARQVAGAMHGGGSLLFTGGGLALYPQYGKGVASLTAGKSALRGLV